MAHTLYDALRGLTNDDEEDLFQCGKCKKQFFSFRAFMHHKKSHQLSNLSIVERLVNNAGNEPEVQTQPIILTESDIISFSLSQAGLNLATPDEITIEEPIEGLLLPVTCSESGPLINLGQPITFLDSDQLIVTANGIEEEDIQKETLQNELANKEELQKIKEAKLRCTYCLKQFTKNFDLQQHLRVHTGERPFKCVVCGRSFTQKSNIKKHMATHKSWPHRIRTLPEKPIQKIPTSSSEVVVVVDESFVCQYCPAAFASFAQLKTHRKTHVNNKIFKCVQKDCEAVFESLDEFLEHTAGHQESCNAQYRCFHCHQTFHSLDELDNHQGLHMPCRKRKHSFLLCKLCKRKFYSVEALERHEIEDSHAYPCPECKKVYVCERHLRRHIRTHSSSLSHTCPICNKNFKTAQNLSVHKLVHSSERPFICKYCPAAFARQDRLIRHTFIHDPNRRYKCPFSKHLGCKKEFYRKDKLKQHLLTHSSSKNLKCLRCNRVFKRSSQLRRHETICLSEDKPCKDCGHVTTSLDHYKKNTTASKETSHVNRRKHRLLEANKKSDDGVPTIQVVVVPINPASSEKITNDSSS